jgi:hypothetical protein
MGTHHEKLEWKIILCPGPFANSNWVSMTPDTAGICPDARPAKLTPESCTTDFLSQLVFAILFLS